MADPDVQKLIGFEFWFTPSDLIPVISPLRYKMVIVTIPVIFLLLLTLVPQIHFVTEMLFIPYSIRFVIAITITVILMISYSKVEGSLMITFGPSLIWFKISSLLEEPTILPIIFTGEYASIFPSLLMGVGP